MTASTGGRRASSSLTRSSPMATPATIRFTGPWWSGDGVCMFHTGYLSDESRCPCPSRVPTDITLMAPAAVDCMARRFPKLRILMAHFGNPWWEEAWKITWSNRNVHADLSGGTALNRSLRMWEDIFRPNGQPRHGHPEPRALRLRHHHLRSAGQRSASGYSRVLRHPLQRPQGPRRSCGRRSIGGRRGSCLSWGNGRGVEEARSGGGRPGHRSIVVEG